MFIQNVSIKVSEISFSERGKEKGGMVQDVQ
jgi:hypothetical protein